VSSGRAEPSDPALSVVISTLGNYALLERVLHGYSAQEAEPGSFEVVVAMDAADPEPDAVDAAIGKRAYPVRRITGLEPGLSANRNAGRRNARGQLVLFTDNDTIPAPTLVSEHLRWHAREPAEEGAVLGHVRWASELEVTPFMRWLDTGIQFTYAHVEPGEVGWGAFSGANVSLKRAFAERVGDFDQEHFPYGYEDTDWAYRASKLGMRLFYNRDAVVDHVRPMTLDFWTKRVRRVAAAEHTFTRVHPEREPWFHGKFTEAMQRPPASRLSERLARFVRPGTPWLGPRVWSNLDAYYKQALAPHFLAAWSEAERSGGRQGQPDLSEFSVESSSGSEPGGPK
jgi:GT2 family glycosyltransferase